MIDSCRIVLCNLPHFSIPTISEKENFAVYQQRSAVLSRFKHHKLDTQIPTNRLAGWLAAGAPSVRLSVCQWMVSRSLSTTRIRQRPDRPTDRLHRRTGNWSFRRWYSVAPAPNLGVMSSSVRPATHSRGATSAKCNQEFLMANSHRPTRRNSTVELRRVGRCELAITLSTVCQCRNVNKR